MTKFLGNGVMPPYNDSYVCGRSCATWYPSSSAPGVSIRFDKPFAEVEGRTCVTVETSKGPIHLKFNTNNKAESYVSDISAIDGPLGIEHYSCTEIKAGNRDAWSQVGMCLHSDQSPVYKHYLTKEAYKTAWPTYTTYVKQYTDAREFIKKKLEGILLYESMYFYNTIHGSMPVPYLKLYIYDKEMKNESLV